MKPTPLELRKRKAMQSMSAKDKAFLAKIRARGFNPDKTSVIGFRAKNGAWLESVVDANEWRALMQLVKRYDVSMVDMLSRTSAPKK